MKPWGAVARASAAVLVAAGLAACSSHATRATPPQATVPVTAPVSDPYAVPAKITVPYVQRVMDALDQVDGDATRIIVKARTIPLAAAQRLHAIDSASWFQEETQTWLDDIAKGLPNLRPVPGNRVDHVDRLLGASRSCLFFLMTSDYSAVDEAPPPPHPNYVVLGLSVGSANVSFNPTGWLVEAEGRTSTGLPPANPCAG